MGIVFLTTGIALFAASVLTRSGGLLAVTNIVIGVQVDLSEPLGGSINITLGLLMLLALWNRRRRRKRPGAAAPGAKSRALLELLVKRMRNQAIPVPA